MKKITALLLILTLITLTACGTSAPAPSETAGSTEGTTPATTAAQESASDFSFKLGDVALVPGAAFDAAALPEAASVYQVPSCAIEGTDNVYNYETVEVTAFDSGSGETIYSIYIIDANTPTTEGLYLGDSLEVVNTLYGTDRTEKENELIYEGANSMLILIMDGDSVASIEYRAITE